VGRSRAAEVKGYGNALCAETAIAFIRATQTCLY
jgi:hypothetical protein